MKNYLLFAGICTTLFACQHKKPGEIYKCKNLSNQTFFPLEGTVGTYRKGQHIYSGIEESVVDSILPGNQTKQTIYLAPIKTSAVVETNNDSYDWGLRCGDCVKSEDNGIVQVFRIKKSN